MEHDEGIPMDIEKVSSPRMHAHAGSAGSPRIAVPMDISPERPPVHSPKKKREDSPEADNEDSEDEEMNVVRRSRKSTERLLVGMSTSPTGSKAKKEFGGGSGTPLGEISKIADKLYKVAVKDDALKRLHRIIFGSDGTATTRKKEIRLWNGTESEANKRVMQTGLAGAKSVSMLKDICSILNLQTGGDRASLEDRIFKFLLKPSGSTAPLPVKKAKKVKKEKPKKVKRETVAKPVSSSNSMFSMFMAKRLPEIKAQAGASMGAREITELLTMEWSIMTPEEKAEFAAPKSPAKPKVQKVIEKKAPVSPRKMETSGNESSSSSSSSSSDSSDDEGSSSSSSSSSDSE
jgi:hypothetical protein